MQNEIWMMENCAWCKKAKQLLDDYGFDYVYINAKANQAEFRAKFPDKFHIQVKELTQQEFNKKEKHVFFEQNI